MQKPKYAGLKMPERGTKFTGAAPDRMSRTTKNPAQKGNPPRKGGSR